MQESSQKVDLLRLSLDRSLVELPEDHPSRCALQEGLSVAASPSYGAPKKPCSAASFSCSSSFFRPASLTGLLGCAVAPPGGAEQIGLAANKNLLYFPSPVSKILFSSVPPGRLDVSVKGCRDLLDKIPGRGHAPQGLSDSRSVRLRKTSKAEEPSCKSPPARPVFALSDLITVGPSRAIKRPEIHLDVSGTNVSPSQTLSWRGGASW